MLGYSEDTPLNLKLKEVIKLDENFDIECVQYMALESTVLCDPEDYGLPEDKKYPMPDKKHVLLAIKFFNATDDPDKQKILAANINKRIKDFNMESEVNVGDKNNFKKFWKPSTEAVITSVAPIVPYQQPALKKAESIDDPLLIQFPVKKKKKDVNLVANESMIFSQKDYMQNLDKWKPGPNNILYITGLSGSGKSTLAKDYAKKYNAHIFELDGLQHNFDSSGKGILEKCKNDIPEYANAVKTFLKEKNDGEFTNDEFNLMKRVAKHVIQLCKEDSETLYIIEGIQLFRWFNRDQFKSKPLIIKGTSMLASSIRGNKRDFTENGKLNKVGMIKTLPQRLKWESEDERSLNRFKKEMKK